MESERSLLAGAESTGQDGVLLMLLAILVDASPKSRVLFSKWK